MENAWRERHIRETLRRGEWNRGNEKKKEGQRMRKRADRKEALNRRGDKYTVQSTEKNR